MTRLQLTDIDGCPVFELGRFWLAFEGLFLTIWWDNRRLARIKRWL